jgi:hypothetical protein
VALRGEGRGGRGLEVMRGDFALIGGPAGSQLSVAQPRSARIFVATCMQVRTPPRERAYAVQ